MFAGYLFNNDTNKFDFNSKTVNYLENQEAVVNFIGANRGKIILITHAFDFKKVIVEIDIDLTIRVGSKKSKESRACKFAKEIALQLNEKY